ncbi:hypothetical protein [Fimbriimonas ginsengisoli]|uniref:Uncharacterized protein n=1 Tax=Fimbriimonas ginsengisoli Gsoil 348 TaxID=661478 RepID=A0A068NJH1_FIMGI|nr:hypothetical protein [Fimbriimonas ginsengisoli]AIE83582.1 hypothetical protein OP10G_0214 [Fimbriimonas ginsengisoli Gsoil 348]
MALPILAPVLKDFAVDAAVKAGRALWSQLPWGKDKARVDAVESRIRRLAADAADLARNLSDESYEAGIERLLNQFQKDLGGFGLTAREAEELTEVERDQIRATILEPARERRQTLRWLEELEKRVKESESAIAGHGTTSERLTSLERQVTNLRIALAVALSLATIATLLSILFFTRR